MKVSDSFKTFIRSLPMFISFHFFVYVSIAHPFPLPCVCLGVSLALEFLMDDDKIGEDFEKFATDNCDIFEDTEVSLFCFVLFCFVCLYISFQFLILILLSPRGAIL